MDRLVLAVFIDQPPRCPRCDQVLVRGQASRERGAGWSAFLCDRRPRLRGRARTENFCRQPLFVWRENGVSYVLSITTTLLESVDDTQPLGANLERMGLGGAVLQIVGRAA